MNKYIKLFLSFFLFPFLLLGTCLGLVCLYIAFKDLNWNFTRVMIWTCSPSHEWVRHLYMVWFMISVTVVWIISRFDD